jgi:diguanylate cyclase (GGDEF)-like protein
MVQDAAGFIWVGTQGGLHRWDGRSFTLYENEPFDRASLPHNLIQTLYMDDDGITLWIGTYGGLARLDTRTGVFSSWTHDSSAPGSLSNDVVVSIGRDAAGRLWVGTLDGLNRMDGDAFVHYAVDPNDPGRLAVGLIRSIFRDSRGTLWVGTSGGGLYRYRPDTDSFAGLRSDAGRDDGLRSDYVFSISEDADGFLWLALWNYGISRYDPRSGSFVGYPLADTRAYFVNADEPGFVRAGTWGGGLFELTVDSGEIRRFSRSTDRQWSLPHDTIYSMLVDHSGNAWIGTNGGGISLMMRDSGGYSIYEHDPADPGSRSSGKTISVLEDRKGRLWVGTYNGGIDRLDPGSSAFRHYRNAPGDPRSLPNDIVVKIYEDSGGTVWTLTNDGLASYDERRDSFDRVARDPDDPDSLAATVLYDMLEEPGTGNYWIATYTEGLEYWDRAADRFVHYPSVQGDPSTPSDNLVYSLAYDRLGRLWAGTNAGLCRYEGDGRFVRYEASREDVTRLPSRSIRDLYVDSSGSLWVSTNGGGLARYVEASDSFEHWTKRDGLQSNIVLGVLEGNAGSIWAMTTNGLSVLEPRSGRWRPFFDQSRLRYGEFTAGRFKSASGTLYFGALNALYVIDSAKASYAAYMPPVRITSIKLLNKELDTGLAPWFVERIGVDWNEAYLSLNFAALEYGDPYRIQYAYMLEGFDEDWVYSGARSYASYTNLPGGRSYVFKVKAANGVGDWSGVATELRIDVRTAPWLRWWAIVLYAAATAGVVWIVGVARSRVALEYRVDELSRLKGQLESANVRLEVLAAHDGLTGLLNRRALDGELSRRGSAASRLGEPISALMVDIDYFKHYNDCYGHQTGDECLIAVANSIRAALERPQDSVSRYGGEEFVALLPGTDEAGARKVAERVRAAVEGLGLPHADSAIASLVTVSVGYASMVPSPDDNPARIVDLADAALYRAKAAGRNRIAS